MMTVGPTTWAPRQAPWTRTAHRLYAASASRSPSRPTSYPPAAARVREAWPLHAAMMAACLELRGASPPRLPVMTMLSTAGATRLVNPRGRSLHAEKCTFGWPALVCCAGTQRYVHLKCLRRWQDVCALRKRVLMMDAKRDGALAHSRPPCHLAVAMSVHGASATCVRGCGSAARLG